MWFAVEEAVNGLDRRLHMSALIIVAVATSVALALTMSAVVRGIQRDVESALPARDVPHGIDLAYIKGVLFEGRWALVVLTIGLTLAFVAVVAWVAAVKRQREIGVKVQYGLHYEDIIAEVVIESCALTALGAATGLLCGVVLCALIPLVLTWLSTDFRWSDTLIVIGSACLGNILTIGMIFDRYAVRPQMEQDL